MEVMLEILDLMTIRCHLLSISRFHNKNKTKIPLKELITAQ